MDAYVNIVLRNIKDLVPKIIGNFLVSNVQSKLQYTIYNEINRKEELLNALGEPAHITAERDTLTKVLAVLNKAKKVLQKDPDLATPLKLEEKDKEEVVPEQKATKQTSVQNSYTPPPKEKEFVQQEQPKSNGYNMGNGVIIDDIKVSPLNGTINANLRPDVKGPIGNVNVPVQVDRGMVAQGVGNAPFGQPVKNTTTNLGPLAAPAQPKTNANTSLFGDLMGGKNGKK